MITSSSPKKIDQHNNFTRCERVTVTMIRDRKIWAVLRTNQIPGILTVHF